MTANEGTKREKRGRGLSVSMVMRLSDWAVRFLLAAVLAGAELMGGHALFALALVAVCRPGAEGLAALLGAGVALVSFPGRLLYTSPSTRDRDKNRMASSALKKNNPLDKSMARVPTPS